MQIEASEVLQLDSSTLTLTLPPGSVALAYLWHETPVLQPEAAPIYAADAYALPAAPWRVEVPLPVMVSK